MYARQAMGREKYQALAAKLQRIIWEQDFVPCWGGEEFVILLPDTGAEQACLAVEKSRHGVAGYVKEIERDELFKQVDETLYRAKADGKNCVVRT